MSFNASVVLLLCDELDIMNTKMDTHKLSLYIFVLIIMCFQFATRNYKIIQIKSEYTKKNDNTPIYNDNDDDDDDFK